LNWNIDFSFAPRPLISAMEPAGVGLRADELEGEGEGAGRSRRRGPGRSGRFSGRSVTIAFSFCVSVIDADSDRFGRISSAASSTRLCFRTTRTAASSAAGRTEAERTIAARKRSVFFTSTKT
jgi:hypothetical protein